MMEFKMEKKNFGIAEFSQEEKWLEEQHKDGWCLIESNRNKYKFERCDAEEWIYQLDFKENNTVEEEYVQMFKDCGWEYILHYGKWCYFRKKKEGSVDLSIFSDRFSKMDMYFRIIKSRSLIVTIVLFILSCVIMVLTIFTNTFKGDSFWGSALPWIGAGFFVATSFSVDQYMKLRKMVDELKVPEK